MSPVLRLVPRALRLLALCTVLAAATATAATTATTATATATTAMPSRPAAATPSRAGAEALRLQRLSTLAALWGEIRYFHPALATRDIDWDRALVEAIPRVNAARDAAQFRAAIDRMLGVLADPATRTVRAVDTAQASADAAQAGEPGSPSPPPAASAPALEEKDGVARIQLALLARTVNESGSSATIGPLLESVQRAMETARVVVFDGRGDLPAEQDQYTAYLMAELIKGLSNAPVLQAALRYRTHVGYAPQTGRMSSGGYSSGLTSERPTEIPGRGAAALPPMVFIVNADSAVPGQLLSGLQATGRVLVVSEGPVDLGASAFKVELGEGLHALVRSTELVSPDGGIGFRADQAVARNAPALLEREVAAAVQRLRAAPNGVLPARAPAAGPALQRGGNDRAYADMAFPGVEYRLLGLFRFWNVIDKFFPYKRLIGPSWDTLLARYIPALEGNRDAVEYQLTLRELATELRDSHAGLGGDTSLSAARLGRNLPPVMSRWVQGETVIVHLLEENTGLRIGDTVLSVDGRPIAELRAKMSRYVAASTPQALQRDLHGNLYRGQPDSEIVFGVRGMDGRERQARLTRSVPGSDPRVRAFELSPRSTPAVSVLPGNIGYVDLARLTPGEVDAMFVAIKDAPAAIFDMRGYPKGTAWSIAPRLTRKQGPVGALFYGPLLHATQRSEADAGALSEYMEQRLPPAQGEPWLGRVVMLVDENTQSQAEHTGLFFEAATEVTFIGSPTAGANGDVTELALPGGLSMSFSGHDVRHADGRQLQRLGIQPQLRVAPTIAGLARGEDEVLAAALAFLGAPAAPATSAPR